MTELRFPACRAVLWDRTAVGPQHHFNPETVVPKRVTVSRGALDALFSSVGRLDTATGFLACRLQDELLVVDSFSLAKHKTTSADTFFAPVSWDRFDGGGGNACRLISRYREFVGSGVRACWSRAVPSLHRFLQPHFACTQQHQQNKVISMRVQGEVVVPNARLTLTPINPLRIVTSPLCHAVVDSGYVTLDQFRNAVLLTDQDPQAYSMPVVGIWLSGLDSVADRFVWSSCLRFCFNKSIKDRASCEPHTFLVVVHQKHTQQATFFECRAKSPSPMLTHFGLDGLVHLGHPANQPNPMFKISRVDNIAKERQWRAAHESKPARNTTTSTIRTTESTESHSPAHKSVRSSPTDNPEWEQFMARYGQNHCRGIGSSDVAGWAKTSRATTSPLSATHQPTTAAVSNSPLKSFGLALHPSPSVLDSIANQKISRNQNEESMVPRSMFDRQQEQLRQMTQQLEKLQKDMDRLSAQSPASPTRHTQATNTSFIVTTTSRHSSSAAAAGGEQPKSPRARVEAVLDQNRTFTPKKAAKIVDSLDDQEQEELLPENPLSSENAPDTTEPPSSPPSQKPQEIQSENQPELCPLVVHHHESSSSWLAQTPPPRTTTNTSPNTRSPNYDEAEQNRLMHKYTASSLVAKYTSPPAATTAAQQFVLPDSAAELISADSEQSFVIPRIQLDEEFHSLLTKDDGTAGDKDDVLHRKYLPGGVADSFSIDDAFVLSAPDQAKFGHAL